MSTHWSCPSRPMPRRTRWARPEPIAVYGDHPQSSKGRGVYRVRRARTLEEGQEAMGIDWMPWKQLTQAIPPAYTKHIGEYLLQSLSSTSRLVSDPSTR